MTDVTIIIGNKNYSSWSLRAWLALRRTGAVFEEVLIPLSESESQDQIARYSPSSRVPVLRHGDVTVWDSLAIGEYLAEQFPDAGLWPDGSTQRASARAVCAEMHAGFMALRNDMPMDMRASHPDHELLPAVANDVNRITEIWREARATAPANSTFLFGDFSLADAFYAPVASRFRTYGVALDPVCQDYVDVIHAWPDMQDWYNAAVIEPFTITDHGNPDT